MAMWFATGSSSVLLYFLKGFSFLLALHIISTQLPIFWCYCSRDGTLQLITSTQSPTVWGYCTRDSTLQLITSTQSPTVWRRLRKPVSSSNVCVFCSKTYHHDNHSVKPYTDYTHYVLFLAFFPRWNSLLLAIPDAYIELSRVD